MSFATEAQILRSVFDLAAGPNRILPTPSDLPMLEGENAKHTNGMEAFWIQSLHRSFELAFPGATVLSKAERDQGWHRHEFLHDLTVVQRRLVKSAYLEVEIPIAARLLWQVESELSGSGREVGIDLSKLVAGSADNKLLVVRLPVEHQKDGVERVTAFVEEAGRGCSGNLFLAFVPSYAMDHPHLGAHWTAPGALPVRLFGRQQGSGLTPLSWPSAEL